MIPESIFVQQVNRSIQTHSFCVRRMYDNDIEYKKQVDIKDLNEEELFEHYSSLKVQLENVNSEIEKRTVK